MPDQWGRLTFNDGMQVAQAAQWLKHENWRNEDRAAEQDAYKVADAIANKQPVTGFSPKARYLGSKAFWDNKYSEIRAKTQEVLNSNAGMRERIFKHQANLADAQEKLRLYRAMRAAGNDAAAKEIALQLNNENMYNGRYIEKGKDGYKVTSWGGTKQTIKDVPIEQVDQLIGAYFGKPQDEIIKWQMSAEQLRSQKNSELLSKAEPYINEKTGQVIYRVPAGTWGPDGKPRGSFFVDSPMAKTELPPEAVKGFKRLSVAKAGLDIQKAKKDLSKPTYASPGNIVSQGGKQGLVDISSGRPQFKEIPGGVGPFSLKSAGKGMTPIQQFNLQVKRLQTELMPFVDKGKSAIDPETFEITSDGRNALMSAMKLVQKYEQDPNSLTPEEDRLVENAYRAVQIYRAISEENKKTFGLKSNQGGTNIPAPPPGFKLD